MPGIPLDDIETVWPLIEGYFVDAMAKSDKPCSIDALKNNFLSGDYVLWVGRNAKCAVMLSICGYKDGKQCEIDSIVGEDMASWIGELQEIEAWAKRAGCNRMILTGRKGWQKMLQQYSIKEVTMVKSL